MAETTGQILDRIIADFNEELASIGNESHIPNRYGMEYCAIVAARYGQALGLDHSRGQERIAELENIMRLTHIHSRKHTPGYCTVRQSDIDAIGNYIDPPLLAKEQ